MPTEFYPKYDAPVIRRDNGELVRDVMKWGIIRTVPGKRPETTLRRAVTNVRNLDSSFWRSTLAKPAQRCLVPFSRFAEPKKGEGRACWWFNVRNEPIGMFAGIWRFNEGEERFAFLTCGYDGDPSAHIVGARHEKAMPVILHREDWMTWLDGDLAQATALATCYPSQLLEVR